MNDHNAQGRRDGGSPGYQGLRLLALLTVIAGVVALAAAAFVLSYPRAIARTEGIPAELARFYPALPDAVLVVACAAALSLRGARWWARRLTWLSIIALVALVGAADAVHAMGINLPRRLAAGAVAVLPWARLLLGFRLWLSVLRHTRRDQKSFATPAVAIPAAANFALTSPAVDRGSVSPAVAGPAHARPAAADPAPASPAADSATPGSALPISPVRDSSAPDSPLPDTSAPVNASPVSPVRDKASPDSAAPDSPLPDPAAPDGSATGGTSSPGPLRRLDLILPPYPDEFRTEVGDGPLPERPAGAEPAHTASCEPDLAASHEPDLAAEQGHELAIDAEPGPDDPSSDEGHDVAGLCHEVGEPADDGTDADSQRLLSEGRGHYNSPAPVTADSDAHDRGQELAVPAPPLSAPVPETGVGQRVLKAGGVPEAEPPESPSPQPEPALPAWALVQSAAEPGTQETEAGEAPGPERRRAQPAARGSKARAQEVAQSPAPETVTDFRRVRSSLIRPANERRAKRAAALLRSLCATDDCRACRIARGQRASRHPPGRGRARSRYASRGSGVDTI